MGEEAMTRYRDKETGEVVDYLGTAVNGNVLYANSAAYEDADVRSATYNDFCARFEPVEEPQP